MRGKSIAIGLPIRRAMWSPISKSKPLSSLGGRSPSTRAHARQRCFGFRVLVEDKLYRFLDVHWIFDPYYRTAGAPNGDSPAASETGEGANGPPQGWQYRCP